MMKNKPVIAVDFDGVVHDYKHPLPDRRMGEPIEGAKVALTKLHPSP
jgi:ribonucleotide monophosphatase NagD (HAD superfamily)